MQTLDSLNKEAAERLYPSLTNPNWLVLRSRRKIFQTWIDSIAGDNLRILDLGGRIQPYRALFGARVAVYWAVDLTYTPVVNVRAKAEAIPFRDELFDVVICTQVLQYIEKPEALVAEVFRVLRPGGQVLLSAPAVFPRDSDGDLWRFMPGSFNLLLKNFTAIQVVAEGSSAAGFCRVLALHAVMFSRPQQLRKVISFTVVPIINLMGATLESFLRTQNDQFSANFSVFARK